jgi:hypothetical protein
MPNTIRLCLALLALTVAAPAYSQQPPPRPGKDRYEEKAHPQDTAKAASRDQRGTASAPLIVKLAPTQRNQEDLAREAREREEKASSDRKLVWWTAVLGVATIGLAALTGTNLWLLWRQSGDLKEQQRLMQRQADHMEEQARQLKASVGQMGDTAERQLRAYLGRSGIPGWHEWGASETGRSFEFRIPIKNAGLTPATRVQAGASVKIYSLPLPRHRSHSPPLRPQGTIGPGQRMKLVAVSDQLSQSDYEAVKHAGSALRVFLEGAVFYRDAFGHEYSFEFFERVEWHGSGILTYPENCYDETRHDPG